jgi:hypothetical protein
LEEALGIAFDTVDRVESEVDTAEWSQVAAKPEVFDLIVRLHIRIGLCKKNLGDEAESVQYFEDAYNIMKSSSRVPGVSKPLMIPIISSLCLLKLRNPNSDSRTNEKLVNKFVSEALENGNSVHVCRALAMEAGFYARQGMFDRAFQTHERLQSMCDQESSHEMILEYGRNFAVECCSEAAQWHYLCERHEEAEQQVDRVIKEYLPLLSSTEADVVMYVVFPLVQVLKLVGRAHDALVLLKDKIIRPYQEGSAASYWEPIFNPLAYLLNLISMEENQSYDDQILDEIEAYVLDDRNHEYISKDLEPQAHTVLGEICWRLLSLDFKKGDPSRRALKRKARELLTPIANSIQSEVFLKQTAQALLEAL